MAQTVRQIPGQLQDGSTITIQGSTPSHANGFSINLCGGPGEVGSTDVALHLNPRFSENTIVRNSHQNGSWGQEDRRGAGIPFQKGQPFECIILVRNDQYMVSFNGQHFTEFGHRVQKDRVNHVIVKGDVQVNNINFSGPGMSGGGFGAPGGYGQPQQPGGFGGQPGGYGGQPMPMSGGYGQPGMGQPGAGQKKQIPGGFHPGRIVYINGTVNQNATRFAVNAKNQEMGGDIALHFNPRVNERAVTMNSLQSGNWGQEVRAQAPFPFVPGSPFQMMLLAEPNQFKIAVNGQHFAEFPLRNPNLQAIQFVEVEGDVSGVQINTP